MKKIYCAGPLFNPKEREDMEDIANILNAEYEVFLPHRDGIELASLNKTLIEQGFFPDVANSLISKAIFQIDTYQIASSDGIVLNLNGRVPDEGTMVEAGIAWTLGKAVVIYKNDARSALLGLDNPMITGLSHFRILDDIKDLPIEFETIFSNGFCPIEIDLDSENSPYSSGKRLFQCYSSTRNDKDRIYDFLNELG
jgi:nucleoside 2-deoxyribosyltransferase